MSKACELYVWIKVAPRRDPPVTQLSTVIWNLGEQDPADERKVKSLGVDLSNSLANPPSPLGPCEFRTFKVPIRDCTLQQAIDYDAPAFVAWKGDAIVLGLHRVSVSAEDTPPVDPFCVTGP